MRREEKKDASLSPKSANNKNVPSRSPKQFFSPKKRNACAIW